MWTRIVICKCGKRREFTTKQRGELDAAMTDAGWIPAVHNYSQGEQKHFDAQCNSCAGIKSSNEVTYSVNSGV
jgi:hypothetical protein